MTHQVPPDSVILSCFLAKGRPRGPNFISFFTLLHLYIYIHAALLLTGPGADCSQLKHKQRPRQTNGGDGLPGAPRPWGCLIFAQMWPNSFCVSLPSKYDCVMSEKAKDWTIHGLWPSDAQDCCPCWPLLPSDLTDLQPELKRHWPTFTNLSSFQFWEKEWRKHGTCAAGIGALSGPKKFFGAALFLRTRYNIDSALEEAEIFPSCRRSYQLSTLAGALRTLLGPQQQLQCVTDGQGRQMLAQIQVSLFSNFSVGCLAATPHPGGFSPYKPCRAPGGVFYPPPNPEDPRHPCP